MNESTDNVINDREITPTEDAQYTVKPQWRQLPVRWDLFGICYNKAESIGSG